MRPANYYVCDSREDSQRCRESLPDKPPGMIAVIEYNAAAHFTGITYRKADAEEIAAVARANRILRHGTGTTMKKTISIIKKTPG